jgi:hypothetical protein
MKEDNSEKNGQNLLPEKQQRVIPFIIAHNTVEEACRQAKITTATYYNWLRESPDFAAAIRDARNELVAESMETLKNNVGRAVDELISLLNSKNEEVKRKSANDVINLALRWRELDEVEDRLESIERIILERKVYR